MNVCSDRKTLHDKINKRLCWRLRSCQEIVFPVGLEVDQMAEMSCCLDNGASIHARSNTIGSNECRNFLATPLRYRRDICEELFSHFLISQ
jgi:hypothetical protein